MKTMKLLPVLTVFILLAIRAGATTFYVDAANLSPASPFTNWPAAATDIQSAIDAATDGDLILVTNGLYNTGGRVVYGALTNRVVINKAVTVQSVNGPAVTVIQGNRSVVVVATAVRCVYLTNGAVLAGFTITNGATLISGDAVREESGGGVWCESTNAVVSNCVLTGNRALNFGGGAFRGTLKNCALQKNSAYAGGGACSNTLNNCLLTGNAAGAVGGGAFQSTLNNCTIVTNYANGGCGVYQCTLNNCISYYNYGGASPNYAGSTLNYCCTTPLPASGIANFTNAPLFVNLTNDFHLQSNSPCINAGINSDISMTNDFDGNSRIVGGTVDVGAYEYQTPALMLSYAWIAWAQQYGLPTDGSAYDVDSDGDGVNNWQEWIAGTNPTNTASFLQMLSTSNSVSGTTVTWQSVSGKTYFMQRSTNLAVQPAFTSIQSNLTGQAGTTSFTDTTATNGNSFFYRVGVQ